MHADFACQRLEKHNKLVLFLTKIYQNKLAVSEASR
jgi:hypothetical protein